MSETSNVLCMVVGYSREDAGSASKYLIKDRYYRFFIPQNLRNVFQISISPSGILSLLQMWCFPNMGRAQLPARNILTDES